MDKQNKPVFCSNLPCQGSENASFNTGTLPWMQPRNWVAPNLASPRPLTQAAKLVDVFQSTSVGRPCHLNSQIFSSEDGGESSPVAAATLSYEELGDGKEEGPLPNEQDFGACNSLVFEKRRLDSSTMCQKRFIMFDQTGSRGRIILHPSQFLMPLPNSAISRPHKHVHSMVSEEMMKLEVPVEGKYVDWETLSSPYNETLVASAFAALQNMREDRLNSVSPVNIGNEFCSGEGEESSSRVSYNRTIQAKSGSSHSQFHEDTEDLEALLSSDDEESSTGHSPSEGTGSNGCMSIEEEDNTDVTSAIRAKRRRIDIMANGEQEVHYIPASIKESDNRYMTNEKCQSPDISVVETSSWDMGNQPKFSADVYDDKYNGNLLYGYSCHGTHGEYSSKGSGNEHMRTVKCRLGHSVSIKNSRKEKIKRTIKLLKSIIPGGDGMDNAIVLDEAIQYVRLLQEKVKKLEANQY